MSDKPANPTPLCDVEDCSRPVGYYGHALGAGIGEWTSVKCWEHGGSFDYGLPTWLLIETTYDEQNGGGTDRTYTAYDDDRRMIGNIRVTVTARSDEDAEILTRIANEMEHGDGLGNYMLCCESCGNGNPHQSRHGWRDEGVLMFLCDECDQPQDLSGECEHCRAVLRKAGQHVE